MRGEPRHHRQQRSLHRRQFWPKKQRHINSGRTFGMPLASCSSASCGLFFRQHDRAFRLRGMAQFQRHAIRRIRLEKMKDAFPEKAAFQPLL